MKLFGLKNLFLLLFVFLGLSVCFSDVFAQTIVFESPLKYKTVEEFAGGFLSALQGVIVLISMTFIVLGGIFYMTSAGNEEKMTKAKKTVTTAMIGLAIGIAAPTFLNEIYNILGATEIPGEVSGAKRLSEIYTRVLNFLLSILGVTAIVMLVSAGIMYLTSAGDETRIETAKKMTKWAIVGVFVALSALIIVRQIASFFS